jgi:hypothetical protein
MVDGLHKHTQNRSVNPLTIASSGVGKALRGGADWVI